MKLKKNSWLVIVAIVVVVIIVLWTSSKKNSNYSSNQPTYTPTQEATKTPGASIQTKSNSTNLTYDQVVKDYATSRIQFNDTCQASTPMNAVKKGTKMLLDNRSKYEKTIKLGNVSYYLPAYGWQIVTMTTTKSLPYNIAISCSSSNGSTVNSTVIKLQANILQGI